MTIAPKGQGAHKGPTNRPKMEAPERAAYLRIFTAQLLADEDFMFLERAEFGSAMLLLFHAWNMEGHLPDDTRRLCALAKCTPAELETLRRNWPKLVPLETLDPEAEPGRLTVPYLWREMQAVMGFYKAQRERSRLGVAARLSGKPMGKPKGEPSGQPMGQPSGEPGGEPNKDKDKSKTKTKESLRGAGVKKSPQWKEAFPPEVAALTEELLTLWPSRAAGDVQPDGSTAVPHASRADLARRLADAIGQGANPAVVRRVALRAVHGWKEQGMWIKAPQHFFGPGGPWEAAYQAAITPKPQPEPAMP